MKALEFFHFSHGKRVCKSGKNEENHHYWINSVTISIFLVFLGANDNCHSSPENNQRHWNALQIFLYRVKSLIQLLCKKLKILIMFFFWTYLFMLLRAFPKLISILLPNHRRDKGLQIHHNSDIHKHTVRAVSRRINLFLVSLDFDYFPDTLYH